MPWHAYSAREYVNMVLCYGMANGNASEALRLYGMQHPSAVQPRDPRVFTRCVQRLLDNQPIVPISEGGGRPIRTATEQAILDVVRENPRLGVRTAAKILRRRHGHRARHVVSYKTVHKVLKRDRQRPYKIHRVHALVPGDRQRRMAYCSWLLGQSRSFVNNIIFTDECTFTNNGMWNRRNAHYWCSQNPNQTQETGFQTRWKHNVWAGIVRDQILGPVFLPPRMDGSAYLNLINGYLADTLDNIPLAQLRETWYQHDGAPPHIARPVRERLTELFGDHWIGRYGPHAWPPRSPDLTPLDFFLWGHVKDRVFDRPCQTADEMRDKIEVVFEQLKQQSLRYGILELVHQKNLERARLCLHVEGRQFEPQLVSVERSFSDIDGE